MAHTAVAKKQSEPKMSRALVRQETIAGYLFLLPSLIFFIGFVIYPMVMCIFTSFFDSSMNRADVFIGLQNYVELFHDSVFWISFKNSVAMIVAMVVVPTVIGLLLVWLTAVRPKASQCQCTRFSTVRCSTITPLGRPVEPEV